MKTNKYSIEFYIKEYEKIKSKLYERTQHKFIHYFKLFNIYNNMYIKTGLNEINVQRIIDYIDCLYILHKKPDLVSSNSEILTIVQRFRTPHTNI